MAGKDRCIVLVLVATVLAGVGPTGSLVAQAKKEPPKAQRKKIAVELDLTGAAIQLKGLKIEKLRGRLTLEQAKMLVVAKDKRLVRLAGRVVRLNGLNVVIQPPQLNPIMKGDYLKALGELQKKRAQLDAIRNPKAARRVVDEMQRILLDARKALWELEQAAKKKAGATKTTADKKNK